ncbi:MAG TPA: hypothetical protein VMC83_02060 [Streptosporangiaceae bacterium]|jgi:hypothetical protein|nr:hypothetical protein [Streptosporangiaceae bacterium]
MAPSKHETGMEAGVDETAARAKASCHLARHTAEVLKIGVKEHADNQRHGSLTDRQLAGICLNDVGHPVPGKPQLVR